MRLSDIIKKKSSQQNSKTEKIPQQPVTQPQHEKQKDENEAKLAVSPETKKSPDGHAEYSGSPTARIYGQLIDEARIIFKSARRGERITLPKSFYELITVCKENPDGMLLYVNRTTPDSYLYSHSVNVAILSCVIAHRTDYDENTLKQLVACAFFHDIGMAELESVVSKKGALTDEEFKHVKSHSSAGQKIIDRLLNTETETKKIVLEVILQIHERIDGNGYPKGIRNDSIHEFAKLIAICDTYESMISPRPYREAVIPHNAIKNIINLAEKNFDVNLIKIFINTFSLYPVGSYARLSNNHIARVLKVNPAMPTRPYINIIIDSNGKKMLQGDNFLNMENSSIISIKEAVNETKIKVDPKIIIELQSQKWWLKGA